MTFRTLALLASYAFASFAHAQTYDFKGTQFGARQAEFAQRNPAYECHVHESDSAIVICELDLEECLRSRYGCAKGTIEAGTYAGEYVNKITAYFLNDSFESLDIVFPSELYETMKSAVQTRFGRPEGAVKNNVQTNAGVKLTNEQTVWTLPGYSLVASKFAGSSAKGSLSATSEAFVRAMQQKKPRRDANRQKNM